MVGLLTPLAGGVVVGVAIAVLLVLNGRVAGISGILGGLIHAEPGERTWRALFVGGLIVGGLVARAVTSDAIGAMSASPAVLAVAGALVGFGTRMAGGCTSGHGVCGVSRLSRRSLVATGTFMLVAALVVFLARRGAGG